MHLFVGASSPISNLHPAHKNTKRNIVITMTRTRRQKAVDRANRGRLEEREPALYQAIADGRDLSEVQCLLRRTKKNRTSNLSLRDAAGNTLLHIAAQKAWLPVVRLLVEEGGMDPNRIGCNGWTALHAAVEYDRYSPKNEVEETVTYLLEQGASLAIRDHLGRGRTPFEMANSRYHTSLAALMLRFYAKRIYARHGCRSLLWIFQNTSGKSWRTWELPLIGCTFDVEDFQTLISLLLDLQSPEDDREESSMLLRHKDKENGDLPMHAILRCSIVAVGVICLLLDKCSDSIHTPNHHGDLPIHVALRHGLTTDPRRQRKSQNGRYEQVCYRDTLTALIWTYPESLGVANEKGDLPIHIALRRKAPIETIDVLLSRYPGSIFVANHRDGDLPIHVACREGASRELLAKLLLVDTEGRETSGEPDSLSTLRERNRKGFLPLHLLCRCFEKTTGAVTSSAADAGIEYLLECFPGSVQAPTETMKGWSGDLPLELACPSASLNVIYKLLRDYPPAISLIAAPSKGHFRSDLDNRVARKKSSKRRKRRQRRFKKRPRKVNKE